MSPILGIYASQISGHLFTLSGSYDALASVTVSGTSTTSITFAGIPQTYSHLQIRSLNRTSITSGGNQYAQIQFNGDSGSNYSIHGLRGDGSSAYSYGVANVGYSSGITSGVTSDTSLSWGGGIIDILDYSNTNKYKTTRGLTGYDGNGSGLLEFNSGAWRNTTAITSITLPISNGYYLANSSFALYGVK